MRKGTKKERKKTVIRGNEKKRKNQPREEGDCVKRNILRKANSIVLSRESEKVVYNKR